MPSNYRFNFSTGEAAIKYLLKVNKLQNTVGMGYKIDRNLHIGVSWFWK